MTTLRFLIVLSVLTLPYLTFAAVSVDVQGIQIDVEPPKGFAPAPATQKWLTEAIAKSVPPSNTLVSYFVTDQAARRLATTADRVVPPRRLVVQVSKRFDNRNVETSDFESTRRVARERQGQPSDEVRAKAKVLLEQRGLVQDNVMSQGVFVDHPQYFGVTNVMTYKNRPPVVVCSMFVFVKKRLLFLYVFVEGGSSADTVWVETVGRDWAEKVIRSN